MKFGSGIFAWLRSKPIVATAWLALVAALMPLARGQSDAGGLQQRGIQRLDAYVEHFRKTFDQRSLLPELAKAEIELTTSAAGFLRGGNEPAAAYSLIKAGDSCRFLNQPQRALEHYDEALRLARKATSTTNQTLALLGRARTEAYVLKQSAPASEHFREAIRVSAGLSDRTHLFNALGGWGSMQAEQGDLIGAADTYARAFTLASELKDDKLLFYAYLDRGDIYQKFAEKCDFQRTFQPCYEQLDLARKDYTAALELAQKLGYDGLARTTQDFIKRLEVRRQMFRTQEQASQHLEKSSLFSPKAPKDVHVSETFTSGSGGIPPGFFGLVQQSGVMDVGDARSFYVRGLYHSMQGEDGPALVAYLKAVDLLDADRRNLRDETGERAILDDRINFYYEPIQTLLQQRRYAEAFALMERSRSRAMTDLIFSGKVALSGAEESGLFGRLQVSRSRIARLQKDVFEARLAADRDRHAEAIKQQETEIARFQQEYDQTAAELARKAPKFGELTAPRSISLERLQQTLRQQQADLLYYLVVEQAVILWHVNGDGSHVRSVFLPRKILPTKVETLRNSMKSDKARFDEQVAREMFLFLIQPALGWIKSKHLIIVAHEDLHYVPFQAFLDPSDNTFLGERFAVTYVPNATLLAEMTPAGPINQGRLLAVSNQSIEDESKEIEGLGLRELYPGRHKLLTDASESEVKRAVGEYELLHLSVHGLFDAREPMLSCLELNKSGTDDGRLTAAEIFGLPLQRARLVTLSACETGQSVTTHANEILGLQRALLYAGAQSLILSAWKVDATATGLWMQTFYREAQTKPLPEAARLSLIEVKKKYPQPYYWAPFQMVGR